MLAIRQAAGFVLAGGRSSRMGVDKATLPYRGLPLAGYIAAQMVPAVDEVSLVGDPARYAGLGWPVIPDAYPGSGPVGGIVTALRTTRSTWNIVSACDLPRVHPDLFEALLNRIREKDVQCVVPLTSDGREQVLCAVYRRDALGALSAALAAGELRLRESVRRLQIDFWRVDASDDWAVNLNTPEDWALFARQEA
jgi:molybdenum cofactor guanylyltransferase